MTSDGKGPHDPDLERTEYLASTSSEILACRGWGHEFPKLIPGRILTGIRMTPTIQGGQQITSVCPTCATERTMTVMRGYKIDDTRNSFYDYTWPDGYASPPGSGVTRWDCRQEVMRRQAEEDALRRAAEERRLAKSKASRRASPAGDPAASGRR